MEKRYIDLVTMLDLVSYFEDLSYYNKNKTSVQDYDKVSTHLKEHITLVVKFLMESATTKKGISENLETKYIGYKDCLDLIELLYKRRFSEEAGDAAALSLHSLEVNDKLNLMRENAKLVIDLV